MREGKASNGFSFSLGTVISTESVEVAECLANSGYDWLFIDMEHSSISLSGAQRILQATQHLCRGIVRIPHLRQEWLQRALDIGADGVVVPQISTAADAESVVKWGKYPPLGERGVGLSRAQGYGTRFHDYLGSANEELAFILQIEHKVAVGNIKEILSVPGFSAVFVGPYDLSASLGLAGELSHPEVVSALHRIEEACRETATPFGIFSPDAASVPSYRERGYSFFAVGVDLGMLTQAASATLKKLRHL